MWSWLDFRQAQEGRHLLSQHGRDGDRDTPLLQAWASAVFRSPLRRLGFLERQAVYLRAWACAHGMGEDGMCSESLTHVSPSQNIVVEDVMKIKNITT